MDLVNTVNYITILHTEWQLELFNYTNVEFKTWSSIYIPMKTMDANTYPCLNPGNLSQ